jgi:5,10-methenyltetrahydrofolate synthetase
MTQDESPGGSAPCFAHELVHGQPVDAQTVRDVARFRRAERVRLLAEREISVSARARAVAGVTRVLKAVLAPEAGLAVAVYWPIRGELDLRDWMRGLHAAGARVLLPVVVEKAAPLVFRRWVPGGRMVRGTWNIPVPAEGAEELPEVVIAPLLGVDDSCYRLGNGGGYYDRTLAALSPRPRVIGVGLAGCRIPTIFPMPWDVPMDEVVLSDGTRMLRRDG